MPANAANQRPGKEALFLRQQESGAFVGPLDLYVGRHANSFNICIYSVEGGSLCCRHKVLSDDPRVACRDFEQCKRWPVGLPAALLPVT